jgi:hypothetical protein
MYDTQIMQQLHPDLGIKNKARTIKVLMLNSKSEFNMKLIRFFKQNLYILNKKGMKFEWVVVFEDEMEMYEQQGLDKFPVMIFNGKNIIGTNSIIDTLKGKPPVQEEYHHQADTRDILYNMIRDKDEGLDDEDNYSKTITQRMANMNRLRQQHGQHTAEEDTAGQQRHQEPTRRPDNIDGMLGSRNEETKMTRESMDNIKASVSQDDDLLRMMMDKMPQGDDDFY